MSCHAWQVGLPPDLSGGPGCPSVGWREPASAGLLGQPGPNREAALKRALAGGVTATFPPRERGGKAERQLKLAGDATSPLAAKSQRARDFARGPKSTELGRAHHPLRQDVRAVGTAHPTWTSCPRRDRPQEEISMTRSFVTSPLLIASANTFAYSLPDPIEWWMSKSDQYVWQWIPDLKVQGIAHGSNWNCPFCGDKIFEGRGHYPWRWHPDRPYKIQCHRAGPRGRRRGGLPRHCVAVPALARLGRRRRAEQLLGRCVPRRRRRAA